MWRNSRPDLKLQGRRLLLDAHPHILFFGKAILRAWKAVRPTLVFVLNVLAALILLSRNGVAAALQPYRELARFRSGSGGTVIAGCRPMVRW